MDLLIKFRYTAQRVIFSIIRTKNHRNTLCTSVFLTKGVKKMSLRRMRRFIQWIRSRHNQCQ